MTELVELNARQHAGLKLVDNCAIATAARQHLLNVRAAEIGKVVTSLPVFLSRTPGSGRWAMSAVMSLKNGENLFVENGSWAATYMPTCLQTYPFFLLSSSESRDGYAIGINPKSDAFSMDWGDALFDEKGDVSPHIVKVRALLKADIENDVQTLLFAERMEELGLSKPVSINVHYEDGPLQSITGLHTIDEEMLASLSPELFEELNKSSYLMVIHAMLISVFQFNALILRHNRIPGRRIIKQVELGPAPDVAEASAGV